MKELVYNKAKVHQLANELAARPDWIVGFVAGEGCFTAFFNKQKAWRFPYQIKPALIVVQHERDVEVLYRLKEIFNCGHVSKNKGKNYNKSKVWQWRVRDIKALCDVIIPFFETHKILTTKEEEFVIFKELCYKIINKHHLNSRESYQECLDLYKALVQQRINSKKLE
jgi:hypothetical protein